MNFIHSGGFRSHSCGFLWIPVSFLWIPVDSTEISSFLQECKGHEEVVIFFS